MPRLEKVTAPGRVPEPPSAWRIPRKRGLLGAVVAAVVLLAVVLYFAFGRSGALTVTVTGPGGRPVEGITVSVDGTKRCDTSPCRIDGLSPGAHLVRAQAKGYQDTAEQAVSITGGEQATHNVSLAPAGEGTGVKVSAAGPGLKLFVDGQEIGELPQTARNLTAGEHTIKVAGDRYDPWEERVKVAENEMKTIGPLVLRVRKGLARISAGSGAEGATVLIDGRLVPKLPASIEVPAGKRVKLTATKSGHARYEESVSFEDGIAEKDFVISLTEGARPAPVAVGSLGPTTAPRPAPAPAPASRTPAKGKGVLNINSIPVTNVILDGRPLGQTPKVGVQVAPGPHTVVFVHPELGRKVVNTTVGAGETKPVMTRLP